MVKTRWNTRFSKHKVWNIQEYYCTSHRDVKSSPGRLKSVDSECEKALLLFVVVSHSVLPLSVVRLQSLCGLPQIRSEAGWEETSLFSSLKNCDRDDWEASQATWREFVRFAVGCWTRTLTQKAQSHFISCLSRPPELLTCYKENMTGKFSQSFLRH